MAWQQWLFLGLGYVLGGITGELLMGLVASNRVVEAERFAEAWRQAAIQAARPFCGKEVPCDADLGV